MSRDISLVTKHSGTRNQTFEKHNTFALNSRSSGTRHQTYAVDTRDSVTRHQKIVLDTTHLYETLENLDLSPRQLDQTLKIHRLDTRWLRQTLDNKILVTRLLCQTLDDCKSLDNLPVVTRHKTFGHQFPNTCYTFDHLILVTRHLCQTLNFEELVIGNLRQILVDTCTVVTRLSLDTRQTETNALKVSLRKSLVHAQLVSSKYDLERLMSSVFCWKQSWSGQSD